MRDTLKPGRIYRGRQRGLWRAVRQQFFGSDIESGYSYIYTWLANQFGHFMIGFAGTIACVWIFTLISPSALKSDGYWPVIIIGLLWLLVWVCKEVGYDIASGLRDLRFAESQRKALLDKSRRLVRRAHRFWPNMEDLGEVWAALREYYFTRRRRPPGKNAPVEDWFKYDLVRDSEMDGWFYLSGIVTALMMYLAPGLTALMMDRAPELAWLWDRLTGVLPFLTFVVLLLCSAWLSANWLWTNIAFDKAQLPFVARFALNGRPPDEKTRQMALDFATLRQGQPGHLVIIGPPKSGRTTTAVALGVETLLQSSPPATLSSTQRFADCWTAPWNVSMTISRDRQGTGPSGRPRRPSFSS